MHWFSGLQDQRLDSIVAELGSSSRSNWQRMFKAPTGLTPVQYRRV
ncbi:MULTISPECIES: hypothetical protein [unclassified Pseudomonas]|nr:MULTISPECIES: hypothetical protein [unclassified Pseudomonas]